MPGRTVLVSLAALVAALVLVVPASALDIADATPPTGTVGVPYSFTFSLAPGSGSAGASWSISSGSLPPGLSLSSNDRTALVYGTPTQAGAFSFYLKVTDAPGPWVCCTEEDFTIPIDPGLDIVSGPNLPSGSVGASYGYQLATSVGSGATWSIGGGSLPSGLGLSPDGAITGTPTSAALAQFTVSARNGSKATSKQLTLRVTEPITVTAPTAPAIKLGRQFLVTFAAKGGLAPYKWSGVGLPEGIGVDPATGRVGGRPKLAGSVPITVEVTDALGTTQRGTATVTVAEALKLGTTELPEARNGKRFSARIVSTGGAAPVAFRLAGTKPGWLSFDAATGVLSGTAKLAPRKPLVVVKRSGKHVKRVFVKRRPLPATYNLYLTATDALGQRSTTHLRLSVKS